MSEAPKRTRPDPGKAEAAKYDPPPPIKGRPVDPNPFPRLSWFGRRKHRGGRK